ncbi:MAG: apolipoprotein N-acyltransferase [Alphaproteobacteria bacterium]|nr:apolipoprotein N-acyltransferase [Alphaproteobacteria bacterium]
MAFFVRLMGALLCGGCAALALAPLYNWPLMIVGYGGLFWLLQRTTAIPTALAYGWAFGVGYFLLGLHWVGHAFMVDADRFAWLMPFALLALSAGLGLFPALAAGLTLRFSTPGLTRLLTFTLFWGLTEWLRGTILTGFPWLLSGHIWAASDISIQGAGFLGASSLGMLAILAAAAPAMIVTRDRFDRKQGVVASLIAGSCVALLLSLSFMRLQDASVAYHADVRLRLVQAGIPQADKWRSELRDQHLALYLRLSLARNGAGQPADYSHLIWPETATPFFLADDHRRRQMISRTLPDGAVLITGSPRKERRTGSPRKEGRSGSELALYNAILSLDSKDHVTAIYDKFHLVPFGEYLPWRKTLSLIGVDKLAHGAVDFSPGEGPRSVVMPGLPPFRPLICYEIVFPREIQGGIFDQSLKPDPEWLLNLTNDAWFGEGFGPRQHLDISRIRAAEQGLPVIRAANTGISAIIDPYGRLMDYLPLAAAGFLDSRLPKALPKTLYAQYGDSIFAIFCIVLGALIFMIRRRAK